MARYVVKCDTCGQSMDFHTWGGNSRDRQWRADHWSHECDECKQKRVSQINEKNAEKNREEGLPLLVGSEKQIAWAETIRASFVQASSNLVVDSSTNYKITKLFKNTSASFWIDRRGRELNKLLEEIEDEEVEIKKDLEQKLQKEAELEATIRPETALSETVAYIFAEDEKICIEFPEKREDFRTLVKAHGFSWGNARWYRKLSITTGSKEDRISEIGNLLLIEGFIVRIFDEELRKKAIEGIYEPEHTRWIRTYKGKFSIKWKRYYEDFYAEARKIPTSKWDNPTVDVKSEQFEAVEDFANEYDFRFTPKALELLEEAKAFKKAQLIPSLKKGKESIKVTSTEKDFTPKEGEIDATLLD